MDLCSATWVLTLLLFQSVLAVDYTEILKSLDEGGLISDRVRRDMEITPAITGLRSNGCPLRASSESHSLGKRSLENHQAAEHVLSVIADLSEEYGEAEAHARIRRQIRFINCASGWAPCSPTHKYRSIDGRCNNLQNPHWGSADTHHLRYTAAQYDDGIGKPRMYSADGKCLPTAREVSKTVHLMAATDKMKMSSDHSHMLMLWGQFIDHDITLTPQRETSGSCCTYDGVWRTGATGKCVDKVSVGSSLRQQLAAQAQLTRNSQRRDTAATSADTNMCLALEVNDETFGAGHTCMEFQRSLAVPYGDCELGPREQLNRNTAFIDGSMVYGSENQIAWELRTNVNGTLLSSTGHLLPHDDRHHELVYSECVNEAECFKAGDTRSNIQPGLASIHTVFMNEHNRIAAILSQQTPPIYTALGESARDDFIYQETRRIVGAMLQHITYNEFLPILLGEKSMKRYGLQVNQGSNYSSAHQPGTRNEFSTFAFRVGHTLIPEGMMPLNGRFTKSAAQEFKFSNITNDPHLVFQYGVGDLLRGVVSEPAKVPGSAITRQLETLFKHSNRTLGGVDLIALNIQRGRDHGIPGYTTLLKHCRLMVPSNFSELNMPLSAQQKLAQVYRSVDDIDAWSGAVSETSLPGAVVGPLNACIIGRQFRSLKKGDRFWYEYQQPNVGFTDGQLSEIYKTSLARVLCDNIDSMTEIQPSVLYMVQWNQIMNKRVPCGSLPQLNLDNWFTR